MNESPKKNEDQHGKSVKKELDHFFHTTSIKGVSKTANAKEIALRIMWLVVLLGGLAVGIWQLVRITSFYFTYSTATSIRKEKRDIPFPDVTVCNLQPISSSTEDDALADLDTFFTLLQHGKMFSRTALGITQMTKKNNFWNISCQL